MTLAHASLSARAMSARVSGVTPRVCRQLSRTCLLTGTLAASRGRWSVMLISMPSSSGRAPPDDLSLSLAIPNPPRGLPEGRSQGSEAVAEVEFERATGLQAVREQGGRAALGRVRHDQLAEPPGVGADRVRAGHGQLVEQALSGSP